MSSNDGKEEARVRLRERESFCLTASASAFGFDAAAARFDLFFIFRFSEVSVGAVSQFGCAFSLSLLHPNLNL